MTFHRTGNETLESRVKKKLVCKDRRGQENTNSIGRRQVRLANASS